MTTPPPRTTEGRVAGKVCIVTGAGSGIGRATAHRLAEEGGRVLCADLSADAAAHTAAEITEAGGTAEPHTVDVSSSAAVDGMVRATVALWGRVDVLVNNAGVNLPGLLHEVPDDIIDRTLDVNVKGQLYGCRAVIPHMLAQGGGSIVNISSVNGLVSEPFLTVYSASKGASVMLTKGVALDYAKQNIRCNVICPGWVDTPINHAHAELLGGLQQVYDTIDSFQPIGRPGEPREIANVALFLASDEASFMTGSVVAVDGGMTSQ
ncbi:glucose 1-dehydrogenase [Streptomyces sp. S3(2020)]|uniref:SDR family NAD(P)-dependent oxidoreductase n=1 Tax=Streptomyces sp. S3(2020) TaxID=2732044 RepID=UPI0014892916|nr:glucose 1-dehydrogenase [Streptomyces sp. S3(2020)]NNN30615.1 glucose 1-dehydrogenase [Streptomyces sp. S3(2020)]